MIPVDLIFSSPPWGGPNYSKQESIDVNDLPISTSKLFHAFSCKTNRIVFFMPRNINIQQMIDLKYGCLEVEETWLNDRLKNYTFYYSPKD